MKWNNDNYIYGTLIRLSTAQKQTHIRNTKHKENNVSVKEYNSRVRQVGPIHVVYS